MAKIAALQEARLFEWQARHAEQTRDWQTRRTAYDQQKHWYAVSLGSDVDRIDVAGGTLSGWSAMLTMIGLPRLQAGGEVTVLDLTDGPVAHDLLAVADRAGLDPLVWVLLGDLPRLDLGTGLEPAALADLLTQVASSPPDSGGGPGGGLGGGPGGGHSVGPSSATTPSWIASWACSGRGPAWPRSPRRCGSWAISVTRARTPRGGC